MSLKGLNCLNSEERKCLSSVKSDNNISNSDARLMLSNEQRRRLQRRLAMLEDNDHVDTDTDITYD